MDVLQEHLVAGLPIIVFVDTGFLTSYWREQTDHAVLVVGSDEQRVYLNDPDLDVARKPVARTEFELAWQEKDYLYAVIRLE